MKSNQMKALALAVLGLAGFGVAGSAMAAACANPTPFAAWSSWNAAATTCNGSPSTGCNAGQSFGGRTDAANGLHTTSCAMSSYFTLAAQSLGEQAVVFDQSPTKEHTYRFRFYIDPTNVKSSLTSLNVTGIFTAKTGLNHGTSPHNQLVFMSLNGDGAGNVFLRTAVACTTGDNFQANRCKANNDVALGNTFTGGVRVEGQAIVGAAGTGIVNVWVGSNVGTPDAVINVDNAAWGGTDGVETAAMGLQHGTATFQTANHTSATNVVFDEFDSRRQTPIGP